MGTHSMQNCTMGMHVVSRESENVRHVGDAMVIFDHTRVSPLFEVSVGDVSEIKSAPTPSFEIKSAPTPSFDWCKWAHKVDLVTNIFYPTLAKQGPRRRLMTRQKRQQTSMAYLQRRGARRRNLKGV